MKHVFNKNVLALLILGTTCLSTGAQAATQEITVTATVVGTVEFDGVASDITIDDFSKSGDKVTEIKFKGNTNAKVKVAVAGANLDGNRLSLTEQTARSEKNKVLMDVKLNETPLEDGEALVDNVAPGAITKLHLTPVKTDSQSAGKYRGVLSISVEPV
ncbi:hypothetical protein ABR28_15570 [Enterobacter hormaechei subsp. hoffmannii]|uniref:hypothetical protein n=1 Tax=Enterobacter hormaechei TaxID=158836 RepID=UPI000643394D|nr:hypothetical protein [Enterobacter hormaechei]KLR21066.1 hypothetical protein ABR28_15570 [Enterobacter hormaechei subsp. hoffmannii]